MKLNKITFIIASILILSSCEKTYLEKSKDTGPEAVFSEFVGILNNKFVLKDQLKFDLKAVTDSMQQAIKADPTEAKLKEQFSNLLPRLQDGHTRLETETEIYTYRYEEGYPKIINEDFLKENYIGESFDSMTLIEGQDFIGQKILYAAYGLLPQDNSIAYIHIPTFTYTITNEQFDKMFETIGSASRLILDLRGNGGGQINVATNLVKRLTSESKQIGVLRIQSPKSSSEFFDSPFITEIASEDVPKFVNKPIVVCVDRSVFSSATFVCEILKGTINPKFVGQRTGGGTSGFISGFLANGWVYQLATSELIRQGANGNEVRTNNGFEPNIQVNSLNLSNNVDEVIQAAVEAF